ncbi:MAG: FtsX-like permease family protein, partial [Bacteroidota bacterium]
LFPGQDALGASVKINGNDYQITGVMKDLPDNVDLEIRGLISLTTFPPTAKQAFETDWGRLAFYSFLLFKQAPDLASFNQKMQAFSEENVLPFWRDNSVEGSMRYELTALTDLHFRTDLSYDTPKGNKTYLYLFGLVATFILLIACFNYINLAIAQATRRAREVGIRKSVGAHPRQLIGQFLGESLVLALVSLGLAIVWVELILPSFNGLAETRFAFADVFDPAMLAAMTGIIVLVGVAAGSYPAFVLAAFRPVAVLKGQITQGRRQYLRKALVVLQFALSIALIIGTLVVNAQMRYLKSQDLGFDQEQTMVIRVANDTSLQRKLSSIMEEFKAMPGVVGVAGAKSRVPGEGTGALLFRVEQDGQLIENQFNVVSVDENFSELLGIELVKGRMFDRSRGTEPKEAFIVNEAFVREMGWQDPIGKRIQWGLMADNQATNDGKVVGVMADYHYASLHNTVEPLVWLFNPNRTSRLLIKLQGTNIRQTVDVIATRWQEIDPNHPLHYFFLDSFFAEQYATEDRLMTIFTWFSLLTILIACMGLFGLASFVTQQRTKEIGIRKVLGASAGQILALISREFAILVVIATGVAIPICVYFSQSWLQGFAYHTSLPWLAFLGASALALAVAWLSTAYHVIKAAQAQPADVLRWE